MATKIEWTDEVWNPIAGCWKQSPGCAHCYAERMAKRLAAMGKAPYTDSSPDTRILDERGRWSGNVWVGGFELLTKPFQWLKPRMVFVNSMSDLFQAPLFGEGCETDAIDQIFAVMAANPQHTFQVLTKRANLMAWYLTAQDVQERIVRAAQGFTKVLAKSPEAGEATNDLRNGKLTWPLPNLWLGVSVENQAAANERIPYLLRSKAVVRFVSCEPLLGEVNLQRVQDRQNFVYYDALRGSRFDYDTEGIGVATPMPAKLHWVIAGGESGPGARPMTADWARKLRDQCRVTGGAFFFKQWGGVDKKAAGRLLDGREWNEMPIHYAKGVK